MAQNVIKLIALSAVVGIVTITTTTDNVYCTETASETQRRWQAEERAANDRRLAEQQRQRAEFDKRNNDVDRKREENVHKKTERKKQK